MVQHIPKLTSPLVDVAGQTVSRATLTGLQQASQKSGVSFQYLVAKAAQESSLQTDAQADTSSAVGLFQFTRGTWLDMMKKHGALYGYGELAQKISFNDDGKAVVRDSAALQRLLALRGNAEASALMAAEYARDNATSLEGTLGRGADAADLYLAHFLGPTGAGQLLQAADAEPAAAAAGLLPAAAKANATVFYTAEGRARTAGEVVKLVRDRFTGQMDRYADVASVLAEHETTKAVVAPGRASENVAANVAASGPAHTAAPIAMAPAPRPVSNLGVLPVRTVDQAQDPSKTMVAHFILEELAKLIAAKPMTMSDGSESDDNDGGDETALSSVGFQGADWAAAMTRSLTKDGSTSLDQAALERELSRSRAGEAKRTYDMLNAVPSAPFIPVRRNGPS